MDKFKLNNFIFQAALSVFEQSDNWVKYGDLLCQTTEKVREVVPEITIDDVERWVKGCVEVAYISVAKSKYNAEITADDYCRGEWLGLVLKQAEQLKKQATEYMSACEFDKAMKTLQKMNNLLNKHGL